MIWLLTIPRAWFLGKKAIRFYALDATIKNQRRMRTEMFLGDAAQLSEIGSSELQPLTRELEELGFVFLVDSLSKTDYASYTPPTATPMPDPHEPQSSSGPKMMVETQTSGIGRLFAHPVHGYYASLVSVVTVSRFPSEMKHADLVNIAPFRTVIVSISGNKEDSWGFATHNREVEPFSLLHRHPCQLSLRMVGASVRQLLNAHLTERHDIAIRGAFRLDSVSALVGQVPGV